MNKRNIFAFLICFLALEISVPGYSAPQIRHKRIFKHHRGRALASIPTVTIAKFDRSKSGYWSVSGEYPVLHSRFRSVATLNVLLKNYTANSLESWVKEQTTYATSQPTNPYFFENKVRSVFFRPGLFSVAAGTGTFTGGAHPNYNFDCENYWIFKSKWEKLSISNLFLPGTDWHSQIDGLVLPILKKKGAEWVWTGDVKSVPEENLSQFSLSKFGITFYFSPYDVGPYAQGIFVIQVPYSHFSHLSRNPIFTHIFNLEK